MSRGISAQQKAILKAIYQGSAGSYGYTPTAVARLAGISEANIRRTVISLEKRGYLIVVGDSDGHKSVTVPAYQWPTYGKVPPFRRTEYKDALWYAVRALPKIDAASLSACPELKELHERYSEEYWEQRAQAEYQGFKVRLETYLAKLNAPSDPELRPDFDWKAAVNGVKALYPESELSKKWSEEARSALPIPLEELHEKIWQAKAPERRAAQSQRRAEIAKTAAAHKRQGFLSERQSRALDIRDKLIEAEVAANGGKPISQERRVEIIREARDIARK